MELKQEKLGTEKGRSLCPGLEAPHFSETQAEHSDGLKIWEHPRRADPQDKSKLEPPLHFAPNRAAGLSPREAGNGSGFEVRQTSSSITS